ncbi:Cytochrome b-c1 complex subunit 6-1 [Ranunculus cassubicifolius]
MFSLITELADEEPVDQKKYLEDSCKPKCVKSLLSYQSCVKRIQGDESGHKHCTGQYFDYWSCVDKCVATKLFSKLK